MTSKKLSMYERCFRPLLELATRLFVREISVVHCRKESRRVRHQSRRKHSEQQCDPSRFRFCRVLLKFLEVFYKGMIMNNFIERQERREELFDEFDEKLTRWQQREYFWHCRRWAVIEGETCCNLGCADNFIVRLTVETFGG